MKAVAGVGTGTAVDAAAAGVGVGTAVAGVVAAAGGGLREQGLLPGHGAENSVAAESCGVCCAGSCCGQKGVTSGWVLDRVVGRVRG